MELANRPDDYILNSSFLIPYSSLLLVEVPLPLGTQQ